VIVGRVILVVVIIIVVAWLVGGFLRSRRH
jgi:hypothetical protein